MIILSWAIKKINWYNLLLSKSQHPQKRIYQQIKCGHQFISEKK